MLEYVNQIANTKGTNDKRGLLERVCMEDAKFKTLLFLTYNPFIQTYMKQVPKPSCSGQETAADSFWEFQDLYHKLSRRELSGNAAKERVSSFMAALDKDAQELFTRSIKGDLKIGMNVTSINKALGEGFIPEFKIQLANTYNPQKLTKSVREIPHFWASPKLNGLRGFYDHTGEYAGSPGFYTRKGHPILGFDHLVVEMAALCSSEGIGFLDGELYSHGVPFQTIQSVVRGVRDVSEERKRGILFNVFAMDESPLVDKWDTSALVEDICNSHLFDGFEHMVPVPYRKVKNNVEAIMEAMLEFTKLGYEGIMLRHPDVPYEFKRGNGLLKFKPFVEHDFRIVGVLPGEPDGKFANTLGAIVVEGEYDGKKIRCEVGSGFSEVGVQWLDWFGGDWGSNPKPPRDWLWANREKLIGLTLEVQFQNVTDKPGNDGYWSLAFPSYRQLKLDR